MEPRPNDVSRLNDDFLKEYSAQENVRKYMKRTAGYGISYLLEHEYGRIYLDIVDKYLVPNAAPQGLRILEFGCGAGMNLIYLMSVLEQRGTKVASAFGTDFSSALIENAKVEAKEALSPASASLIQFCVAKNESLVDDMARALNRAKDALLGSFDLIFGVNTIRYCHRLKNENENALGIYQLLKEQGVSIVIDMNDKFPAFRSYFRDRMTMEKDSYYLPSLAEYARPFEAGGFEILRKDNFCWVPHSAGHSLTSVMRTMTPLLNGVFPSRAMRSIVIARKPTRPGS